MFVPREKDKKWIFGSQPNWITAWLCVLHLIMPPNVSIVIPGNIDELRITVAGAVYTIHPTLRIAKSSQMRNDDAAFD